MTTTQQQKLFDHAPQLAAGKPSKSVVARVRQRLRLRRGKQCMIRIADLFIDPSYQRKQLDKVKKMAEEFDFAACGSLVVGRRPDGKHYVIDGQQRRAAAALRGDVSHLPCVVHETAGPEEEAAIFHVVNSNRSGLSAFATFHADVTGGEWDAVKLKAMLDEAGLEAAEGQRPGVVCCLSALRRCINKDEETFRAIWPILVALSEGACMDNRVVLAIFYIERRLRGTNDSLAGPRIRNRIVSIGMDVLALACKRASSFYLKGGERVWGDAVLMEINKGLRHKLVIDGHNGIK